MSAGASRTVTYRIVRISPIRTARIVAVMWVLAGIPYAFFAQRPPWMPHDGWRWFIVVFPLLYGLFGCVLTLAVVAVYNLVAPRVGGLVYTARMPSTREAEGAAL